MLNAPATRFVGLDNGLGLRLSAQLSSTPGLATERTGFRSAGAAAGFAPKPASDQRLLDRVALPPPPSLANASALPAASVLHYATHCVTPVRAALNHPTALDHASSVAPLVCDLATIVEGSLAACSSSPAAAH